MRTKNFSKIIFKYKVKRLISNFTKKLRLNSIFRSPSQCDALQTNITNQQNSSLDSTEFSKLRQKFNEFKNQEGFNIGNVGLIIWSLINILQITIMVFVISISMTFSQTQDYLFFMYFRIISIFLFIIDMILNFTIKRYEGSKYLQKIHQISAFYMTNGFVVDLISIIIFPIDIFVSQKSNVTIIISFIVIIKLVNNIRKFQKFEYFLINSTQKEQYYGLIKVFLTNFAIGHFLSIFLNLMAYIDDYSDQVNINWTSKFGIQQSQWYIKYIWGYYWGTNIMLTVGFGDFFATNYYQAIILVFIQTFSCITLAYNINYVGAIISSMRQGQQQKKQKLKIFHRMCKENFVQNQMQQKIANFIEQSYRIKQSFQYDARDQLLKSLPKILERDYRKQANKTLFDNLGFLNNLSKKTLLKLAQQIGRKICHPEQVILRKGGVSDFIILQKGCLALTCRINSTLDGKQMQVLQIKQRQKPKILSLDFIKNKTLKYNIKSNTYSILYYLNREDFMEVLRTSQMDYQMLCVLKDKDTNQVYENNLYLCQICKTQYHNKFECSRLHLIPLKRHIVNRYLHKVNKLKQKRQVNFVRKKIFLSSLFSLQELKSNQQKIIQDNFDKQHYEQILQIREFYRKYMGQNINQKQNQSQNFITKQTQTLSNFQSKKGNFRGILDQKVIMKLQQMFQNKTNNVHSFWQFQIDEAHNFKYYFSEGNPSSLKKTRKSRRTKIVVTQYF